MPYDVIADTLLPYLVEEKTGYLKKPISTLFRLVARSARVDLSPEIRDGGFKIAAVQN